MMCKVGASNRTIDSWFISLNFTDGRITVLRLLHDLSFKPSKYHLKLRFIQSTVEHQQLAFAALSWCRLYKIHDKEYITSSLCIAKSKNVNRNKVDYTSSITKFLNFPSKKSLNFLVLVFLSGKTNHKKSLKVKPWGSKIKLVTNEPRTFST